MDPPVPRTSYLREDTSLDAVARFLADRVFDHYRLLATDLDSAFTKTLREADMDLELQNRAVFCARLRRTHPPRPARRPGPHRRRHQPHCDDLSKQALNHDSLKGSPKIRGMS